MFKNHIWSATPFFKVITLRYREDWVMPWLYFRLKRDLKTTEEEKKIAFAMGIANVLGYAAAFGLGCGLERKWSRYVFIVPGLSLMLIANGGIYLYWNDFRDQFVINPMSRERYEELKEKLNKA